MTTLVGPSLANVLPDQKFRLERDRYFVTDQMDHVQKSKPMIHLA